MAIIVLYEVNDRKVSLYIPNIHTKLHYIPYCVKQKTSLKTFSEVVYLLFSVLNNLQYISCPPGKTKA